MDREDTFRRLASARVGHLATVRPDGRPQVVPLVFAIVDDGAVARTYWMVDDKPKRSDSFAAN